MLYAFLPDRWADYIMHVGHVANRSFGGFLTGQIIDSAIVGLLCFLGMSVMNMPYAMLSSVIVGVTNIIPYFGPIIGAIPGVVLLLLSNPIKAVLFVILIVCIQQFDGNIMAPRIVGSSIGVSGVWVLFSVWDCLPAAPEQKNPLYPNPIPRQFPSCRRNPPSPRKMGQNPVLTLSRTPRKRFP